MASAVFDLDYAVLMTSGPNGFEFCIRELHLTVRAPSLEEGWRLLLERKRRLLEMAREAGLLDEVPPPAPPPAITCFKVPGPRRASRANIPRM